MNGVQRYMKGMNRMSGYRTKKKVEEKAVEPTSERETGKGE